MRLLEQLQQTLTWDCGKELAGHAERMRATDTLVFFGNPRAPWQRPSTTAEAISPKGTDMSRSAEDLESDAPVASNRPRRLLGWGTPAKALEA